MNIKVTTSDSKVYNIKDASCVVLTEEPKLTEAEMLKLRAEIAADCYASWHSIEQLR